jgi:hypothetical protein
MSQPPTPYDRSYNFTDFQTTNPTTPLPGNKVDQELNNVRTSLNATISRLSEIQRDDGKVRDSALNLDTIAQAVSPQVSIAATQAISAAGATQVAAVNSAGSTQIAAVNAAGSSITGTASAAAASASAAATSASVAGANANTAQAQANNASTQVTLAVQAKNQAGVYSAQASQSATAAGVYANNAADAAASSLTRANNAASSASQAQASASDANASKMAALQAKADVQAIADGVANVSVDAASAATSAANAAASATYASNAAGNAATYASNAATSAAAASASAASVAVLEAPVDGQQYARQNAGWSLVTAGGPSSALTSDQVNSITTAQYKDYTQPVTGSTGDGIVSFSDSAGADGKYVQFYTGTGSSYWQIQDNGSYWSFYVPFQDDSNNDYTTADLQSWLNGSGHALIILSISSVVSLSTLNFSNVAMYKPQHSIASGDRLMIEQGLRTYFKQDINTNGAVYNAAWYYDGNIVTWGKPWQTEGYVFTGSVNGWTNTNSFYGTVNFSGTATFSNSLNVTGSLSATSGTVLVPTQAVGTTGNYAASVNYVLGNASATTPLMDGTAAIGTSTRFARADHVHPSDTTKAGLSSPAFTGTPTAPTASANTNTTQLATTAFVVSQAGTATPLIDGTAAVGTSLLYARQDHVHPTDTTRAALASPTFTGVPAAPTAAANTNTTQLATTAFVLGQGNSTAATIAMNGTQAAGTSNLYARADHVHPTDTTRAALASPTFTGVPSAPTATAGTNTTQIATTAFVLANAGGTFATVAQAKGFASTTTVLSPNLAMWQQMSPNIIHIQRGALSYTATGTMGTLYQGSYTSSMNLGGIGVCSGNLQVFGVSQVDQGYIVVSPGYRSYINFSKPTWCSGRAYFESVPTDSNVVARFTFGKAANSGVGEPARASFGWKFIGGSSSPKLILQAHNGTTLTNVTSTFSPVSQQFFDWDVVSDGAGNVTLYVNGASVATTSAGPNADTSYSGSSPVIWQEEIQALATVTATGIVFARGKLAVIN